MGLGENIKKFRKAANLTQKELANKCGYATGTIQQYELGKRVPSYVRISEIAEALNIPSYALLEDVDRQSLDNQFNIEFSRKEKRRLQYLQSLGYKIVLHPDYSFEIHCDGFKYSIPVLEPEAYYDQICEVVDSAATNIIEEIIEKFKNTESEE